MTFVSLLTIISLVFGALPDVYGDPYHPYNLNVSCPNGYEFIKKKTALKAMACPMIRDEEGFLSEWISYYQIHGFDHIILYDDLSMKNVSSLPEVQPWIKSGFVTVISGLTPEKMNLDKSLMKDKFSALMKFKHSIEADCRRKAVSWGYDFQVSLDLDEYLMPKNGKMTIVDALASSKANFFLFPKYNYQASPHILEPVDLLTIEAYQLRMKTMAKMNYYISVSPKAGYRLKGSSFTAETQRFVSDCCHFHRCAKQDIFAGVTFCKDNYDKISPYFARESGSAFRMNHYARSLEKFELKGKTWAVAGGVDADGEVVKHNLPNYFARSVGFHRDPVALRYACQVRANIKEVEGDLAEYLRPGDFWYRNPEFGKPISDPDKRGRYGRPNKPNFVVSEKNPFSFA